jgi:hypothetical protein
MEYVQTRKCKLMQVGELLDSKGYGIALPIGKPFNFSSLLISLLKKGHPIYAENKNLMANP